MRAISVLAVIVVVMLIGSVALAQDGAQEAVDDAVKQALEPMVKGLQQAVEGLAKQMGFRVPAELKLHYAAAQGDEGEVKKLLAGGADVNARDGSGQTPAHYGARTWGGMKALKILLKAGADVNAIDLDGSTPLHLALSSGSGDASHETVELLIAAKANIHAIDLDGDTPLHLASGRGGKDDTQSLLTAGAEVDAVNLLGETPLHCAGENGWDGVVEVLLAAKADVHKRTSAGWSALALATDSCYWDVTALLEKAGAKEETWTPLHLAAIESEPKQVAKLLADGAKVDATDRYGRTPLIWAATTQGDDVVKTLLAAKAKIELADAKKLTPLLAAARVGNKDGLKILLAAKAKGDARDEDGWTALHFAANALNPEMVKMLLAAKAPADARDGWRETPLLLAVLEAREAHFKDDEIEAVVRALLKGGADVLAGDIHGRTPAEKAFWTGEKGRELIALAAIDAKGALWDRLFAKYAAEKVSASLATMATPTPADALRKMIRALYVGDEKSFASCFVGSPAEMKAMEAMRATQTGFAFRKAMIAAYGAAGWKEFRRPRKGISFSFPYVDEAVVAEVAIKIDGDRASCQCLPGLNLIGVERIRLRKVGGSWKVVVGSLLGVSDPEAIIGLLNSMAECLTKTAKHIGKDGNTPEDIHRIMNENL